MPAANNAHIAQSARALWGGVHGVCILGLSHRLDVVGADSVEKLLQRLMLTYIAGLKAEI
jgi:hypothetical protein